MKKMILLLSMMILLGACGKPTAEGRSELFISTASSLIEAMKAMELEFEKVQPEINLVFNYGSSGKLSSQIQQGAPVDVFLSASEKDMSVLTNKGLILKGTVTPFAENHLVLAASGLEESKDFLQLLKSTEETLAVGEPESVPLGEYTKEALINLDVWDSLQGRMIYAKDARQVLTYVESKNAGLGIVYLSDTRISPDITVISELPKGMHPIVYPAGIATESKNQEAAKVFLAFLKGKEGQQILEQYGFSTLNGETP